MNNQQILEKAIKLAIAGGWGIDFTAKDSLRIWENKSTTEMIDYRPIEYMFNEDNYKDVIFNHDFAKALWGEEKLSDKCKCGAEGEHSAFSPKPHGLAYRKLGWQKHLQQMVIAPDPIKYLGENI